MTAALRRATAARSHATAAGSRTTAALRHATAAGSRQARERSHYVREGSRATAARRHAGAALRRAAREGSRRLRERRRHVAERSPDASEGARFPRLQILTIEELLQGAQLLYPDLQLGHATHKRATRRGKQQQGGFDF